MRMNDYQESAMCFARYEDEIYPWLAISEEAGECMGKIAKFVRRTGHMPAFPAEAMAHDYHLSEDEEKLHADLTKELGDVLWQVQAAAHSLGLTLEDLAWANLCKLRGRDERGTIVGEGDER